MFVFAHVGRERNCIQTETERLGNELNTWARTPSSDYNQCIYLFIGELVNVECNCSYIKKTRNGNCTFTVSSVYQFCTVCSLIFSLLLPHTPAAFPNYVTPNSLLFAIYRLELTALCSSTKLGIKRNSPFLVVRWSLVVSGGSSSYHDVWRFVLSAPNNS